MRLRSIQIRHYKSITDVELVDMPPITVLVGCNGVGKSNVVDVLRFLRDAVREGLDHAVGKRGGIALVRQYSPTRPYRIILDFGFEETTEAGDPLAAEYHLALTSLREGNFRIESESGRWMEKVQTWNEEQQEWDTSEYLNIAFERGADGRLQLNGETGSKILPADTIALGSRILTHDYTDRVALPIARFVANFRFSSIYPNTLRAPAHPDTAPILKDNGENWASVIRILRKSAKGKQALEQIKEMMQVVMPQFEDITTQAIGGFILPRFKVRDSQEGSAHVFDPSQVSDGTLRIFGILLGLYQIPRPTLMVIEEPEQTVNPALLALLVDAFREVSETTQLFITSHSPHLVDYLDPAEIRVVSMSEGETRVSPIRSSQAEAVKEHLLSLEQLMSAEGLLPEEE